MNLLLSSVSSSRPVATGGDPFWSDVQALFEFDGDFTDSSSFSRSIVETSAPLVLETTAPIGGTGSMLCDGSDSFTVPGGNAWQFVDGSDVNIDFTVEFFMQSRSDLGTPGTGDGLVGCSDTNNSRWILFLNTNTRLDIFAAGNVLHLTSNGSGINLNDDAVHHIAWVREGTTSSLYIDGNRIDSTTSSYNYSNGPIRPLSIADDPEGFGSSRTWANGMIDGVRVTHAARYSGSTYTVPTLPYPKG